MSKRWLEGIWIESGGCFENQKLIHTKDMSDIFHSAKIFFDTKFCWAKNVLDPTFLDLPKLFLDTKLFWSWHFMDPTFFWSKHFVVPNSARFYLNFPTGKLFGKSSFLQKIFAVGGTLGSHFNHRWFQSQTDIKLFDLMFKIIK